MLHRLAGRTALVTGAGRGIGAHVAARFAVEGARVAFADRDHAAARVAAAAFPDAVAIEMDVADESSVMAGFAAAASRGLESDVVVANAGVQLFGQDAKIADLDLEVWNPYGRDQFHRHLPDRQTCHACRARRRPVGEGWLDHPDRQPHRAHW